MDSGELRRLVENERIELLVSGSPQRGDFVLYWMQSDQRTRDNPALNLAVAEADELGLPVLVVFGLDAAYPEANIRHFHFLLEGLRDLEQRLGELGIGFVVIGDRPPEAAAAASERAALVVTDRGPLPLHLQWRKELQRKLSGRRLPLVVVEGNTVVPVRMAADKAQWSAGTFRPRIHKQLPKFLVPPAGPACPRRSAEGISRSFPAGGKVISKLPADAEKLFRKKDAAERNGTADSPGPSPWFTGGESAAFERLESFVEQSLPLYAGRRSDPSLGIQSTLSPYLHFGHISPKTIAARVEDSRTPPDAKRAFLEELIVRRELSFNLVHYRPDFHRYRSLPDWARKSLAEHSDDRRPSLYSRKQLEEGNTHDRWWNAAMRQMRITGFMHNYMRMYWGKKVLEWTASPRTAFNRLVYLNNRWFLDGRDPNSYAGVGWCFGLHDRAWTERPVFGKIRYMNDRGLERKFDIEGYARQMEALGPEGE
ncbi:MAG: deoxyribodipyrimidine photo-lyase [Spirochaetales bacterium]|nr:deoxyribodipyrimidine photo-lyase [Spirochaetales bacterium]MCF7939766.1 deoxyribodipyrimidine photo-lyase [Spirochaetales bacterium]